MISRLRLSIKHLLVLLFGGITLVAALPTYWYVDHIYAAQLVRDRGESLNDMAKATASVLAANLRERQREIYLLAQSNLFRTGKLNDTELQAVLDRAQASFLHYSWMGLADAAGTVRAATGGTLLGKDVQARPWYSFGRKQGYSGDLHQAVLLAKLLPPEPGGAVLQLIDFSEPVMDNQGVVRGVLGAHVNWNWAASVLQNMQPTNAAESRIEILIVNRDNAIIHPQRLETTPALPLASNSSAKFSHDVWPNGQTYVSSTVPVADGPPDRTMGWRIVVRQPIEQAFHDLKTIQNLLLVTTLISATIFLTLIWRGATLISRPLKELAAHARSIERGDETEPLTAPAQAREMRDLVQALQGMASTLLQRKNALAQSNAVLEQTVAQRTAELVRSNEELHRLSRRDALTGLFNRLAAKERLHAEFMRMKRVQTPYAVLMMDIDYFKRVNDTYGHDTGDKVLQMAAKVLETHLRETDFLARFGGEEFLVLLPDTDFAAAAEVAEKLRAAVAIAPSATGHPVTLSLGLAMAATTDTSEDDAVQRADGFLYRAKHAGRNRVATQDSA